MSDKYPKSEGVLFINTDREKDSHPNWRGHIVVTKEQVMQIRRMVEAGQEPRLQVAAWNRKAQGTGAKYLFLSTEAYMKEPKRSSDGWDDDDDRPSRRSRPKPRPKADDEWEDDDIPF